MWTLCILSCSTMKSLLFLSLLLGELFLISTGQGVIYCVKPNSTATCSTEDHCQLQQCQTLQYYFDNVNSTINLVKNATMIFMEGSHTTNVSSNVTISAPTLNISVKGQTTTVTLILQTACQNNVSFWCNLIFESTHLTMDNLKINTQLDHLITDPDSPHMSFVISATKVSLNDCTFKYSQYNILSVITISYAKDILLKDCIFDDYNVISITNSDKANLMSTEHTLEGNILNITLENCTFTSSIQIADAKYTMLKDCTFSSIFSIIEITDTENVTLKGCTLTDSMLEVAGTNHAIIEDCTFTDTLLEITDVRYAMLEDCTFTASTILSDSSSITMYGNISIQNSQNLNGAMILESSNLTIAAGADVIFFNNSALNSGGALLLMFSGFYIEKGTSVKFINNTANDKGGAIHVKPGISSVILGITFDVKAKCLFQLINCSNSTAEILFANNSAGNRGDDIYGAILEECYSHQTDQLKIDRTGPPSMSSVSSDPQRVCLCDSHGAPQCNKVYNTHQLIPGESFTVPAVLVGWDYQNTTTGVVHADFLHTSNSMTTILDSTSQRGHVISNSKQCTNLTFTLYSKPSTEIVTMYTTAVHMDTQTAHDFCLPYHINPLYCDYEDHITPVFFHFTILPCPAGFKLSHQSCDCYLHDTFFDSCSIVNGIGHFSWSKTVWVSIEKDALLYSTRCPFDYCNITGKEINLQNDSDSQCAFNRAGRLCGGCKENYSLAIGSSHCIHCPNNNNLALLIFFAAAGILLVFFISAFNLTVTQGMINGLIFYANIVWTYQSIFFPQEQNFNNTLSFTKVFIAWVNLDFGIETCFVNRLDAFWKTWVQYLFPFYTAGLFFLGLRYSSKLSKLFGNRSVPTLATLLFLSYTKLLRTIITSLELAHLTNYPGNLSQYVWTIDGNLKYGQFPHITLLLMAIACLLILWLPYTMLLFLMQWLRRVPNYRISKWITRYKPVIDAYFAPLKDKHHYWFGVLLLSRGILLLVSSLTANIYPAISLFLLLAMATLLLCYTNHMQVYKRKSVLILESAFLINLIILTGGTMYYNNVKSSEKVALIYSSIGIAFIKFCGIVIWSIVQLFPHCTRCQMTNNVPYGNIDESTQISHDQRRETLQDSDQLRDSILDDSQLIPTY